MKDDTTHQLSDVIDRYVVALFLAFAEEHKILALGGKTPEAVWAVTVMGVIDAVGERRTNKSQRSGKFAPQHHFARQMHNAMKAARLGAGRFGNWFGRIFVDSIGANINHMRDRPILERRARRLAHADVFHQHRHVFDRRVGGDEDQHIVRTQFLGQPGRGIGCEQIAGFPAKRNDFNSVGPQAAR